MIIRDITRLIVRLAILRHLRKHDEDSCMLPYFLEKESMFLVGKEEKTNGGRHELRRYIIY